MVFGKYAVIFKLQKLMVFGKCAVAFKQQQFKVFDKFNSCGVDKYLQ